MNFFNYFLIITLLAASLQCVLGLPRHEFYQASPSRELKPFLSPRAAESQQVDDAQMPEVEETNQQSQEPVEEPAKPEEPVVQAEQPVKQLHEKIAPAIPTERIAEGGCGSCSSGCNNCVGNCHSCTRRCKMCAGIHKPDYTKAIAIAVGGKKLATKATLIAAAPALFNSAKVAALAGLIPVKLAATGAIVGTLIAKPIIVSAAITGAIATKLAHIFVGKPIKIASKLLAGAAALKAKAKAKKANCLAPACLDSNN